MFTFCTKINLLPLSRNSISGENVYALFYFQCYPLIFSLVIELLGVGDELLFYEIAHTDFTQNRGASKLLLLKNFIQCSGVQ